MHKFREVKSFKKVLASAHALVKKVNKSSKATERLVSLCRKKLISDCPTRWSSTLFPDPRYRLLLNPNQIMSPKAHLMSLLKDHPESSESSSATQSPKPPAGTEEPLIKHFYHLASVSEQ